MSAPSDASLLRDWSIAGSEKAFSDLARRYAGLLDHAALRRTGSDDLAGEAAQNSLLILARKAHRLTDLPSLAGWLHRTVCYEAAKILRRERRHEARMKNLHPPDDASDGESPWQETAPLLDEALDDLSEKERQVIFLKYFDGLSFEQMARQFGGEPAAWRQRGSRAVEKLRQTLGKRGVAVSSASLATGLGSSFSQAAPASIVTALSASPLAGATTLSWSTLLFHSLCLMKAKSTVVLTAAMILTLSTLGLQSLALAGARSRIAALEGRPPTKAEGFATTRSSSDLPPDRSRLHADIAVLAHAYMAGYHGDYISLDAAGRRVSTMGLAELESLIHAAAEEPLAPKARLALMPALFTRYCALAQECGLSFEHFAAVATLAAKSCQPSYRGSLWSRSGGIVDHWMREEPVAAIAWYREALAAGLLGTPSAREWTGSVFRMLHETQPDQAMALYRSLPDHDRATVIDGDGVRNDPEFAIGLAAVIENPGSRLRALESAFTGSENAKPTVVRSWLDSLDVSDDDAFRLLVNAARGMKDRPNREDIAARLAWLREAGAGYDLSGATASYFVKVNGFTADLRAAFDDEWKRNPDEKMLAAYVAGLSYAGDGGKSHAFEMSHHIKDPVLRDESLKKMLVLLPGDHPEDRRKEALRIGMSQEEVQRLFPTKP